MKQSAPYFYLQFNYEAYGNVESTEAKALVQISVLILSPSSHPSLLFKSSNNSENRASSAAFRNKEIAVGATLGWAAALGKLLLFC